MIRLRNARVDDAVLCDLIRKELIPHSHTVHWNDAPTIRELPKRFRRGVTFVAAAGKTAPPLGFIHLIAAGEWLYVDMLAVHPANRERGLGRQLLSACEAYGRERGCTAAFLFVDESNPGARRFYERLGYSAAGFSPVTRCYEMVKRLV
ncbi:GNAT family N-acetyltransferase [Paenibacillus thailandensis]|uniref:GNAT family N-acetyltransferase n=1 Tax=Paenibacillus thailandensis TaxID=393250 RepID=A0ABW5QWD1_9BACL